MRSTLQHTAEHVLTRHCNTLQNMFNTQDTATHCRILHQTAPHRNMVALYEPKKERAKCCNALQHFAPHCTTLQHGSTRCTTLQHGSTRCAKEGMHACIGGCICCLGHMCRRVNLSTQSHIYLSISTCTCIFICNYTYTCKYTYTYM